MTRGGKLPEGPGQFKTRDDLTLWYRIAGEGPPLLVPSPGWGASVDMYMKSLGPLEQNFSLVYLDTRGAGRSEAPKKSSGFKFQNFLNDIEKLRMHLSIDRWLIFAHSDASLQALGYAIEHARACRGLFIVGGTLNIEDKEWKSDMRARRKKLLREPWFAATNRPSPHTDDGFRQSFLDVQLPLYFCNAAAAKKALHYFSASTYRIENNTYDDYTPRFPPAKLAQIVSRLRCS